MGEERFQVSRGFLRRVERLILQSVGLFFPVRKRCVCGAAPQDFSVPLSNKESNYHVIPKERGRNSIIVLEEYKKNN